MWLCSHDRRGAPRVTGLLLFIYTCTLPRRLHTHRTHLHILYTSARVQTLPQHHPLQRLRRSAYARPTVTQPAEPAADSSRPRPSAAPCILPPSFPGAHPPWHASTPLQRNLPCWCRQTSPSQLLHVRRIVFFVSIAHESPWTIMRRGPCFTTRPNTGLATPPCDSRLLESAVMAALQTADYRRRSYVSVRISHIPPSLLTGPARIGSPQLVIAAKAIFPAMSCLSGLFVVLLPKAWSKQRVRK